MSEYKNPTIPVLENAHGLDAQLSRIQKRLALEPWNEKAFGRAFIKEVSEGGKSSKSVKVYLKDGEYTDPGLNDNLKASTFFLTRGPRQYLDDPGDGTPKINQPVSQGMDLIILFNQKKVARELDLADEYINEYLIERLFLVMNYGFPVADLRIYDDQGSNIFRGWKIDDIRHLLMHPFYGIRVEFDLTYIQSSCGVPANIGQAIAYTPNPIIINNYYGNDEVTLESLTSQSITDIIKITRVEFAEIEIPDPSIAYIFIDDPTLSDLTTQNISDIIRISREEFGELEEVDPNAAYIFTDDPTLADLNTAGIADFIKLTQAEYDALEEIDPDTLYHIIDI